ncbi:alpha/beta fold hydrolase [Vibrio aestuarianus]|uniref:alpha/beta fold hydrolase n=1 Tax=Vibrio aestuarianus TaxID=28171 RepID=UPI00237C9CDE|nr:alpha/beta hydrolase [Vibrio aestuarianus]MDE1332731.1 alpha/beta hydrolase [Vibrio aestuarianus]
MEINQIILNDNQFRFSLYKNNQSEQYVVFLLGALQDIESVDSFSRVFSQEVNCLTVEIPGTGRTKPLDSTISIREQTLMLLDFIQYMDLKKVHIIAFSYATAISVELCSIWPYVTSLSICGGVPGIPKSGRYATKQMIAAAMQGPEVFAKVFTRSLSVDNSEIPKNKAIQRATERNIAKMTPDRIDVFFENSIRLLVHTPSNIENIKIPCTICVGELDPYVTKEVAFEFSQKLVNSNFLIIKNADHFIHLEYPDRLSSILIAQAASSVAIEKTLKNLSS